MSSNSTPGGIFTDSAMSDITNATTQSTTMAPSPPSESEAVLYYWGLPSCPRLVARSSTNAWQPPSPSPNHVATSKSLRPAGGDPLLHRLWNDATSSLRIQIVEALSAAVWTAVDILRIGRDGDFHTTLLVSVKPASLSWAQAHPITLRCKGILEDHSIDNVHCEIRESIVVPCGNVSSRSESAAATAQTPSDFQLSSAATANQRADRVDLSDCIGTRISMKDDDTRFGTKGLYLSLKRSDTQDSIVALTCQHVAANQKRGRIETRIRRPQTPREVVQIDQPEYEASSSRTFGTLLFSPEPKYSRALRDMPGYDPWLRDWALIELLPSHHQAPLDTLRNRVFVGPPGMLHLLVRRRMRNFEGLPELLKRVPRAVDGTLPLARTAVPMSEIFQPAHNAGDDEPKMLVSQHGAGGELAVGLGNTLKSLVRRDGALDEGVEDYGEEWAITSLKGSHFQMPFSWPGDSGSCVWDIQTQRPAAIIMAGGRSPEVTTVNDVTYAQPLERLLGDIREYSFDVELV
ncbi:hypothetical protein HDV63DRAFT_411991 [Trichoderma sp. SZMC 28014]